MQRKSAYELYEAQWVSDRDFRNQQRFRLWALMTRGLLRTSIIVFISSGIFGQSIVAPPSFEVAAIRPNKSSSGAIGMFPSPGRLLVKNYTLRTLIQDTYNLKRFQVLDGPRWLDSERYDIEAKAEGNVGLKQMIPMLQTLLTDRFQLRFHQEKRSLPAYKLVITKRQPKLYVSEKRDSTAPSLTIRSSEFICHKVSMQLFADALSAQLGRPVIDDTKLGGKYDFSLEYTPEWSDPVDPNAPSGASIFTAIQEQLGLKLLASKAPVEVIVVEHAEKPIPE